MPRESFKQKYPFHDFRGSFNRDEHLHIGHITRPGGISSLLQDHASRFFIRLRKNERFVKKLTENWDNIPLENQVNPGDQVVIRQKGKIINILQKVIGGGGGIAIAHLAIIPLTIESIEQESGKIHSITTLIPNKNDKGDIENIKLTIPAADFRLLSTFQADVKANHGSTFPLEKLLP